MRGDDECGRVPPHDLDAEELVLGAIMQDQEALARILRMLGPDDFYRANNGLIYKAAVALFREGEPIDNVTLAVELRADGLLERVGGRTFLAHLQELRTMPADVDHYAHAVRHLAVERRHIVESLLGLSSQLTLTTEAETRTLDVIARLLPFDERARFVAEEHGNLGSCNHWWQRVDHLVRLALGTPRLAWMMHRENRRGRA